MQAAEEAGPAGEPSAAGAGRAPRRGGLLWQRDFRLLWTGETISGLGGSMAGVGVPLLVVQSLHASTFAVSARSAAGYLPWLLIGLPAGAWVDRLPARRLMIACDLIAALLFTSIPVARSPPARPRVGSGRPACCWPRASGCRCSGCSSR